MDFTDAVISDLKGKAKGSLVDYNGAQVIVNAVKALDSLNSEAAQSISRLVQRCTDEYQKLISDPSMSELVPSQLEVQQVLKTGIAARDAKAKKAKTGEDKTSAGSQLKQDDDENIDGEPLPGEWGRCYAGVTRRYLGGAFGCFFCLDSWQFRLSL